MRLFRKHDVQNVSMLRRNFVEPSALDVTLDTNLDHSSIDTAASHYTTFTYDYEEAGEDLVDDTVVELDNYCFSKSVANCFNTWMNVRNIAYSTVQEIVTEYFESHSMGAEICKKNLEKLLQDKGLDASLVNEMEDPFKEASDNLKREKDRIRFIKTELGCYVGPETVVLTNDDPNIKSSYQYIDLQKTLKTMMEDPSYIEQRIEDPYVQQDNVVKDIRDGSNFRLNNFFQANPDACPLLLFQERITTS